MTTEGLFVGILDENQLEEFNQAVKDGKARRSYEGAAGFMGLAKVRWIPQSITETPSTDE